MKYFEKAEGFGDPYFQWLCEDLYSHGAKDYWFLLRALYLKPFYWILSEDAQMVDDGLTLREIYRNAWKGDILNENPNCLEVLSALSMKLENACTEVSHKEWFYIFIENLGLLKMHDDKFIARGGYDYVNYILAKWLTRSYSRFGNWTGCLFPCMRRKGKDQRKLSIWEQAVTYIREMSWLCVPETGYMHDNIDTIELKGELL